MHNIILTGMPGAGKSTIGPEIAKALGMDYIDTDQIIRDAEGRELKEIVSSLGREEFMRIQDRTIVSLQLENHVIATGGSVACSDIAMDHLRKCGIAIYLEYELAEIKSRLDPDRKLARENGQDLGSLYIERTPFYEKNSDFIVRCSGKDTGEILKEILGLIPGD